MSVWRGGGWLLRLVEVEVEGRVVGAVEEEDEDWRRLSEVEGSPWIAPGARRRREEENLSIMMLLGMTL